MLDGKGEKKRHTMKWKRYIMRKNRGGLGLKDVRWQGISLSSK